MSEANVSLPRADNTDFSPFDDATKVVMTVAYGIIFPVALLGNVLVISLVLKLPSMRSFTNMLLVNMCVANLLVTIFAMPYSTVYLFLQYRWFSGHLGNITCKLTHFSYALSIAASIFALLLISLDRYHAVLHPFRRRPRFLRSVKLTSLGIWFFSCVCMSPYLFQFRIVKYQAMFVCMIDWSPLDTIVASKVYFITAFVLLYSVPLLGIALAYSLIGRNLWQRKIPGQQMMSNIRVAQRSKLKVIRMLIIVVVVFALCWIPAHLMHFLSYFQKPTYFSLHPLVLLLFYWLCHANSAISPWLFLIMHHNFRQGIRRLFKGHVMSSPQPSSLSTHCTRGHSVVVRHVALKGSQNVRAGDNATVL